MLPLYWPGLSQKDRLRDLYAAACHLYDAGDHQGVVNLIRSQAKPLKIKINETEMHNTGSSFTMA